MREFKYFIVIFILFASCTTKQEKENNRDDNSNDSEQSTEYYEESTEESYPDGTYCAEVEYHNPNTGTNSTYTLTIEVESNEVIQINWPSGGWMDNDHFYGAELDENGYTSFTSDRGYDYEISVSGSGSDCFADVPMAQQCAGTTEDGDQCENMTDNPNGLCWQHQDQE